MNGHTRHLPEFRSTQLQQNPRQFIDQAERAAFALQELRRLPSSNFNSAKSIHGREGVNVNKAANVVTTRARHPPPVSSHDTNSGLKPSTGGGT